MADPTIKPFNGSLDAPQAKTSALSPFDGTLDGETPSRGFKGWARDIAGTAINSAIGVPEAVVGVADAATNIGASVLGFESPQLGKRVEDLGVRFNDAKKFVNESIKSDASREARRKFSEADGIVDKTVAAVQNPSLILEGVGESLGAMGAGGVASRGLMAATKLGQMGATGAALAGAAGEGITMAGSAAEQIRQETPDGLLTPTQAGLAAATGVAGAAIGAVGGRVAQKLGIGDAETLLAQGSKGMAKANADVAARAAVNPLVQQQAVKSIPRRVIEGAISEGFLEELPQSVAEQVFQNVALGKDWLQDVDAAVVMGVLSGSAMGGAAAGYHGIRQPKAGEPSAAPGNVPPAGGEQPSAGARNPGLDRIQQSFADQLAALQQQEQGEPAVPQTTPPDGAAVLAQQQAAEAARRQAAIDASRAVASPDDEIFQSTGATVPRSVAMGLDPAAGPLSASAALAVDSGASDQIQQAAALAQAAEVAQKQGKKPAQSNQKQEQKTATQQGVNPETGEILQDTPIDTWTDAQLSEVFRGAQSREVRMQLAKELGRRRDLREQQELQAELDAEQRASVPGAERADAAFASLIEDAGEVPADLTNPATTEGNRNGPQATQAQQDRAQPPQVGAAPAVASAAPAAQGRGSAQGPGAAGVAGGTETANAGAQAAPATGAQAAAPAEGPAQRVADTGDAWTRMPTAERQALAQRAELKPIVRKNVHRAAWADLNRDVQRRLADALHAGAPVQEPAPKVAEAAPAVTNESEQNPNGTSTDKAPVAINSVAESEAQEGAVAVVPAPKRTAPRGVLAKKAQAEEKARADYFTPGNIVKSYGGHDRVVSYLPPDESGRWSVTVQAVRPENGTWVDVPQVRERVHATAPDARDLKSGPLVRMPQEDAQGLMEGDAAAPANDRDAFTLQRLNQATRKMEPVTFVRGEYVRHKLGYGEIDGISQARSEFRVDGVWQPFGFAYKAERPVAPNANAVPLSTVIDEVNVKNDQGLTDADRVPEQKPVSKTPTIDRHNAVMAAVREGKATPEQFRASFDQVVDGKAAVVAELETMTKAQLLSEGGAFVQMRYANEKKADVADAVYREMVGEYALGESVTYSMGKGAFEAAVRKMVEATDAEKLARYVAELTAAIEENQARRVAKAAAIANPKTLADFREALSAKIRDGMTRKEAFLALTPDQRIQYDTLEAESTREARETRKRAQKTQVRAAGQATAGEIVATKHTRDGYDLFVVKLADRLGADDYKTVLASAKRLGGWYSAFRGNGAVPGFQFKDKSNAEAFLALAGGDATAAQEQAAQRRDAFEDDRSQTAVERLRAMADKLEAQAQEVEGQQRKTNTERRARFASAALQSAAADKAKAQTMRNIAQAIEDGKAKFLDEVRTKSQVDMLTGIVDTAKGAELRAKYPSYADQEKRKGEPPTAETADFADFPSYSAFRSDLATMGRQMLEVDGTKKLGQRLMSVADDVTDSYLEFAKANFRDVSQFGRGDSLADFASKDEAERAIKRSGLTGKAIVLPVKRGQNRVILSPAEASGRGVWKGDGDKRITLTAEFGAEMVEAIGRRGNKQNQLSVPWQFQTAYDRRKALARIGIETPSEFRAALREFIDLKEQAIANRTRELELQMVGRKADGLDFFPTSAEIADQMIEAADLAPDMAVLEPSAGMGHLADRIREAGAEPDVIEISSDRRALLEEKGYTNQAVNDFLDLKPRGFFTFGDTFRAPDGAEGIMRGANGNRVRLVSEAGDMVGAGYYDRAELTGVAHNGTASGYDRIIMNPPFSNRRDAEHVRHAFTLLKPGGRIVAIMGEGVFFGQDKKAQDFREWLEAVGGTSEKLPEGSFMDPSLPVNTGASARMVVIEKSMGNVENTPNESGDAGADALAFRREEDGRATPFDVGAFLKARGRPSAYSEAAQRQAADSVSATVDAIRAAWGPNAPEVVVAFDMQDERIPEAARKADLRQRSGGARGAPEGFYYRGKAYLMASRLPTPNDAARVLYHEVLGHHGLRGKFGRELDQVLNQIATMRKAEVAAKMQEYGLRGVNSLRVREAAEEVLAEMAEKNPQLPFVQRAISAIRNFLRTHVPGFQSLRLTDSDIIQAYILPARGWVERGGPGGGQGTELGFSRSDDTPLREASTFTEARVAAQEFQGKALTNEATGLQANVSRNTLDKMLSRKAVEKSASAQAQSRAVANLDRLYQGAIFGWSKEDRDGNTNVRAVHRFFVPMEMDGRMLMAKLTVKETVDANHANPLYTVEAVDFNEKSPAAVWVDASAKADGIDLTSIRSAGEVLSLAQEIEQRNAEDDGDTMFSRSKMEGLGASALDLLQQTMRHEGKVSLWDKTVGTMRNLAERSPVFKPVYEAAQRFIDDVSMLGNDAADRAPRLLPRVETLADLKKKPITAADNQAVAKPLFEGTLLWARDVDGTPVTTEALNAKYRDSTPDEKAQILLRTGKIQEQMLKVWRGLPVDQYNTIINNKFDSTILKPGVVWTAKELQDLFGLNAQQVSLYQEARAAIDRSIDMTARADMLRVLGADYADMREAVLAQANAEDAMVLITDALQAEAREAPDQADRILSLNNAVVKSHERAQALMDAGYAPLSRFGRYTVDVVSPDGTREYFGMFESVYESNKMKAAMEKEFPGATVTQGTMSDEAFKLFQGITPESLEQFGNMLGLSGDGDDAKDKAFQAYLQLAKNNHSALKRLIHRKGISGYSEDVGRVLASFVYSNARLAAGGLNAGTLEKAIEGIPKEQGELRDVAMGLRSYIQDPQEEGQAVRGMLFAQYLGGSVASAMVNMTQPFQITMPWLSQFGGMRSAASHLASAVRDMARRSGYEPDLAKALHAAEAEGIVSPQEIHQLMAQARGAGSLRTGDGTKMGDARATAANNWERVKVAWGQPFALAEQFNRRSTFIAAYRMAKEQGMADPAKFAERAVLETQFVYSKANKPKWARGTIGGTLFTFKTYSVSYLELMHRMWTQGGPEGKRAVGWAVAMLLLMGGAGGLPFMEDAEDLIDGAGQLMGYNVSTKQWRKQALRDTIGKELADFVENGVSGLPGAPIDVSGRLGMGNLIPGTGLLLSKQSRERDLLEVAGPAGDLVARGFTGARKVLTGDLAGAALEVSPTAVRNAFKGADMATSGIYKDTKGYKVIDTTLDEAISKAIGFQPKSVAEVQEANAFMQRSKSFYIQTSSDIKAQWAQAVFEKDDAALQRVRDRLAAWNRNNPDQPIVVKIPDVMKRVREMGKDRTERIADTAPKALRERMRDLAREASQGPA